MNPPTQTPKLICAIALGSNLGDRLTTLEKAIVALDKIPSINLKSHSSWYQTAPVGPPQPDYLNGCALLEVQLPPQKLMSTLLAVEKEFGRVRRQRWGARTLDLDIIFLGDLVIDTPNLKVPHPRREERAFVLMPLAEIAPDWLDPLTGKTVKQLLQGVDCSGVQLIYPRKTR